MPALPDDTQLQDYKFGDISRKMVIDVKLGAEGLKKGFESVVQSVTKNEVTRFFFVFFLSRSCVAVIVSR